MSKTFLSAQWEHLIMANYAVNPECLKPFIPAGLELDAHQGNIYVSLVGFMFKNTRLFQIPIPFFGSFEEVNLRFYVKRETEHGLRRGVVFINETVPYRAVAWLANKLYKEHYTAIPTKHSIEQAAGMKHIRYEWKCNKKWNSLAVEASSAEILMIPGSVEEFIFEHYYGYTKINAFDTEEYEVKHPRWSVSTVLSSAVDCDFNAMYGAPFSFLSQQKPDSVMLAAGSSVRVKWNRNRI